LNVNAFLPDETCVANCITDSKLREYRLDSGMKRFTRTMARKARGFDQDNIQSFFCAGYRG
jgi:hypothetical protein